MLKGYLLTRQPVRGIEGSNGHARMPGELRRVHRRHQQPVRQLLHNGPAAELNKKLIDLVAMRGKPYGIVVREMDFPSSVSIDDARRVLSGVPSGGSFPVVQPILVYRVYPDGREELVRGMGFRGFNARSFKDILAAGDDMNRFDFLDIRRALRPDGSRRLRSRTLPWWRPRS